MITLTAFPPLLLVATGGAIGSMLRYLVGRWALLAFGPGFPVGTLVVNLLGGLAMGLVVGTLARIGHGGEQLRMLFGVGVLGGFTTFSAFSLELVNMVTHGDVGLAAGYAAASVLGSMAALFIGLWLVRGLGAA